MLDSALLKALELLTPDEQDAMRAIAEYLKQQRGHHTQLQSPAAALLNELSAGAPRFATGDQGLSPASQAARRFMEENPKLMGLLAK